MKRFDYLIIGGGIVGLSTAWAILEKDPDAKIAVLEKESGWARHQSGHNSGVIHSGIYYKPGSLKATLCKQGGARLVDFCEAHGISHEICGKVIIATKSSEIPQLVKLQERGMENGLSVRSLHPDQVRELEPNVRCLAGLHVPSTGIVDYPAVCRKLAELIEQAGGELHLQAKVTRIRVDSEEAIVETEQGEFATKWLVNCAGLHSDRVALLAGDEPEARIVPFRGEYYELKPARRHLVKNLIYPVPDPAFPFLGVHFTRGIDGSVHAGPNAVLSFKREGYRKTSFDLGDCAGTMLYPGFWRFAAKHLAAGLREMHRSLSKSAFVHSLQQLIPEVQSDDLIPVEGGVRAQAMARDGRLIDDFAIVRGPRTTHVCNAPSPAATASLEIGNYIAQNILNNPGMIPVS